MMKLAQLADGYIRRAIAVMAVLAFAAAAFGHICHHPDAVPDSTSIYMVANSSTPGETELPSGVTLCGHHCMTCVSVILPQMLGAETVNTLAELSFYRPVMALNSHRPELQTPPPKSLT